jgi:hypothetical protein
MGFMDKAKKLADQAQTKLDEVQKQFNEGQGHSQNPSASSGQAVEYDQHGRPLSPSDAPADKRPHVAPEPGDSHTQGDPLAEEAESTPKPSQPPSGGTGMTSGDPLAG